MILNPTSARWCCWCCLLPRQIWICGWSRPTSFRTQSPLWHTSRLPLWTSHWYSWSSWRSLRNIKSFPNPQASQPPQRWLRAGLISLAYCQPEQLSIFPFCSSCIGQSTLSCLWSFAYLDRDRSTCNIKNQNNNAGILQIAGDERAKPLLSCRVPQLQPEILIEHSQIFGHEVNANSGLHLTSHTPIPSSNLSEINLIKMEVFPVDWSPKNTSLILLFTWERSDYDFFKLLSIAIITNPSLEDTPLINIRINTRDWCINGELSHEAIII